MKDEKQSARRAVLDKGAVDVCVGCGACVGVCAQKALQLAVDQRGALAPVFAASSDKCNRCGLCLRVCRRGREILLSNPLVEAGSLAELERRWKDKPVYAVHSTDAERRKECASGGFVSSLFCRLLETKTVDSCIVVVRDEGDPLLSRAVAVRTPEEVFAARGSKYSPVDYSDVATILDQAQDGEKIAIVGLPCQLAALDAALERFPKRREKVFMKVSLLCGHTPSFIAYEYLFKKIGFCRNDVRSLANRGGGWPGYLSATRRDGRQWRCRYGAFLSWGALLSSPFTENFGCHFCADPCGFTADVVVSDAWLDDYRRDDNPGDNLILVRNEKFLPLVTEMLKDGTFEGKPETFERFVKANRRVFVRKSIGAAAAEHFLLKKSKQNEKLAVLYHSLSQTARWKLRFFYWNVALYRKFSFALPLCKPLLLYGKCLAYFCRSKEIK